MRKEILLPAVAVAGGGAGFVLRRWELALLLGALNGAVGFASNAQRKSEQLRRERPNCRKACAGMQKSRTAKLPRTI